MTLRQKLITSLKERIPVEVNNFSSVKIIRDYDPEEMIDIAIPFVYQYTRPSRFAAACTLLVELCTAIGHPIMKKYGTPKNSALAARVGAFVLWSFEEEGLITHRMSNSGRSKNGSYIIEMLDEKAITELWEELAVEKTEKLPYEAPLQPWDCGWKMGHKMIKTGDIDLLKSLHPNKHPILFKTLNISEQVGWRINRDVLALVMWALNNRTDAFSDIWEQTDKQAKASKSREARTIYSMASRFANKTFYHMYYYDFRGRKYPATAYLHEQGSDLAKSLIIRADSKPLTDRGFFWLMVQIANNWAGSAGRPDGLKTDKIPMIDRFKWALDNEAMLIDFAIKSKTSTGWMNADNPWQFLAYCIELRKFRMWQLLNGTAIKNGTISPFAYECSMEGYLDGSNNGSQHLAALTRDEETAPHVNLVYSEFPGDLYKYVAGFVWKEINNICGQLPGDVYKDLVKVIEIVQREKKLISSAPDIGTLKKELTNKFKEFRSEFKEEIKKAAPVFWSLVDQDKDRRKIVKR